MPPPKGGFCVFMEMFNIFSQLALELDEFFKEKVHIAGVNENNSLPNLSKQKKGYEFSQWETLNTIELYYNSKFESGEIDSEGQRKIFLNIGQFRADVASKQVDMDVKDFVFIPDDGQSVWPAYFLTKKFKQWAKKEGFGQFINEIVSDAPKYGSAVGKLVGSKIVRVPLRSLRNQQSASSLATASFVIEEHRDMTLDDMKKMKGWNLEGVNLKFGEKANVFERHGKVPLSFYKQQNKQKIETGDDLIGVDCMAILLPGEEKKNENGGNILFLEEEKERPYEEVHWKQQDGRWLGLGEIENQFENQVTRNMIVNLRRRALIWSSKKLFQSADTEVAKNLVRDVRDGDVLKVLPTGLISQVNMATQNLGEFQSMEDVWEKNSDQKSFTYEVATGEALPSGTPFRLGVVLSNSVNSHFALKRENLGLFFGRLIENKLMKAFEKDNRREHELMMFADEEGVEHLKQELIKIHSNQEAKRQLLNGFLPNMDEIFQKVTEEILDRKNISMIMPEGFYEEMKASVTLVSTGENINLEKKLETLTNFYNSLVQTGNPAASVVLKRILALTGENYDVLAGVQPQNVTSQNQMQPMQNQMQSMQMSPSALQPAL